MGAFSMVDGCYKFWRIYFSGYRVIVEVLRLVVCLMNDKTAYYARMTDCSVES